MKFLPLFVLLLPASFQQLTKQTIDAEVNRIDSSNLDIKEFDTNDVYNQVTDGGGHILLFMEEGELLKAEQWVGLSFGASFTIIYFQNDKPIKIIEAEENFPMDLETQTSNPEVLERVYTEEIYLYDWNMDKVEIFKSGKRNVTEGTCGIYEYQPLIDLFKSLAN